MWAGYNISLDLVWSWTLSTWVLVCSEFCIIHSCNAPGEFQELSTPKSVANIIQYHFLNILQYYTYKWYKNQHIYIYTYKWLLWTYHLLNIYSIFMRINSPNINHCGLVAQRWSPGLCVSHGTSTSSNLRGAVPPSHRAFFRCGWEETGPKGTFGGALDLWI